MICREFIIGTLAISTFSESVFASADVLIVNWTVSCCCWGTWVKRMISERFKIEANFVNDEVLMSIKSHWPHLPISGHAKRLQLVGILLKAMYLQKISVGHILRDRRLLV